MSQDTSTEEDLALTDAVQVGVQLQGIDLHTTRNIEEISLAYEGLIFVDKNKQTKGPRRQDACAENDSAQVRQNLPTNKTN